MPTRDDGYRQLEIYQLARSLAVFVQHLTLSAPASGWMEETRELRMAARGVVQEIVSGYLVRSARSASVSALQRAHNHCSKVLDLVQHLNAGGFFQIREQYQYLLSSYEGLDKLVDKAMVLDADSQGSPFRVKEELVVYAAHEERTADPLEGKLVLVTRTREQSQSVVELLERHGAYTAHLPTIQILDPDSWEACDRAIINLRQYDGILFTSKNAVDRFLHRIDAVNSDARSVLATRSVYAVGEKTEAALTIAGIHVATTPEIYSAEELAETFDRADVLGKRFLVPKSNIGRDILPNALRAMDATVDEVVVYKTVPPQPSELETIRSALNSGEISAVTFFSPSSVRNFLQMMGHKCLEDVPIAVIGPTTADAAQNLGLTVSIVAQEATSESLVGGLVDHFSSRQ